MRATSVVLALFALAAAPAAASPTNIVDHSPISPGTEPPPQNPPQPPPPPTQQPLAPDLPRPAPEIPAASGAPAPLPPLPTETDHKPDTGGTLSSYRKYTLAIDGLSVALILTGRLIGGENPTAGPQAVATIGLIGAAFGVPALHGSRGHAERAARSMGLRLASGAAGLYVQSKFTDCGGFRQCLDPSGPGILIGAVVAGAVDALFMTGEHKAEPALKPVAFGTRGGGMFGFAGTF